MEDHNWSFFKVVILRNVKDEMVRPGRLHYFLCTNISCTIFKTVVFGRFTAVGVIPRHMLLSQSCALTSATRQSLSDRLLPSR